MAAAEKVFERKCQGRLTNACDVAVFDWVGAQEDVTAALAGWSPYGG
jgi:hypothetical protein